MKSIGILTSGGDCAGLNAVIRAAVHRAIEGYDLRVTGIQDGTHGLIARPVLADELNLDLFTGNILRMGGTILGTTNKGDPFDFPMPDGSRKDVSQYFIDGVRMLGLDGIIGIGGDGSLDILDRLSVQGGFSFIGVPKTIDNDVPKTDYSVGFSTAVSSAVDALDRLQPTAASHDRVMVLEVMGRNAGFIALNAGIAGGADVILLPEIPYRIEAVAAKLASIIKTGRKHSLVICAEAAKPVGASSPAKPDGGGASVFSGVGEQLGREITETTGAETRVTVLGHVQRGGPPNSFDRIMGSAFGVCAVDLLATGMTRRMVAWSSGQVVDVDLAKVAGRSRSVDLGDPLITAARGLGICLGD